MSIKNFLFDLDGTLLPMDQDRFIKSYLYELSQKMSTRGYDPDLFLSNIFESIKLMIKNDGAVTNETVFKNFFAATYSSLSDKDYDFLENFYREDFQKFKAICGYEPRSAKLVKKLKDAGFRVVLATNPLFPKIATLSRIKWAGLDANDFELVTTYENIGYSKPNPQYYSKIAECLKMNPDECLMIGNDVRDDMAAQDAGMHVFLLTDGLINKKNVDISVYRNGNFDELEKYIDSVI